MDDDWNMPFSMKITVNSFAHFTLKISVIDAIQFWFQMTVANAIDSLNLKMTETMLLLHFSLVLFE